MLSQRLRATSDRLLDLMDEQSQGSANLLRAREPWPACRRAARCSRRGRVLRRGRAPLLASRTQAQQAALQEWRAAHPLGAAAAFSAVYVALTGLSLPVAAPPRSQPVRSSAPLGNDPRVVCASDRRDAALPRLRFVLRDRVQAKYGAQLRRSTAASRRKARSTSSPAARSRGAVLRHQPGDGPHAHARWHLLLGEPARHARRNDRLRLRGHPARQDHVAGGVLSPELIGAFVLLGFFPLIAKKVLDAYKARKVYARWRRPARFDRNLVVIGAGLGGARVGLHRGRR